MKSRFIANYIIIVAALGVVLWSLYLLYMQEEHTKFLLLTIIGCSMVAVGQVLMIRQKKKNSK